MQRRVIGAPDERDSQPDARGPPFFQDPHSGPAGSSYLNVGAAQLLSTDWIVAGGAIVPCPDLRRSPEACAMIFPGMLLEDRDSMQGMEQRLRPRPRFVCNHSPARTKPALRDVPCKARRPAPKFEIRRLFPRAVSTLLWRSACLHSQRDARFSSLQPAFRRLRFSACMSFLGNARSCTPPRRRQKSQCKYSYACAVQHFVQPIERESHLP